MNLRLNDRRSGSALVFPGVAFQVTRARWDLYGGPASAEVVATGPAGRLGQLVQLLRSAAMITDDAGAPAWWGYVHSVDLKIDGLRVTASLEDLYNRVAVRYRDERISPDVNVGWQFQTAWQQDNNSVTEYGKKEGVFPRPYGFPAEATAYAASLLARYKRPESRSAVAALSGPAERQGAAASSAVLHLRGWWETLGWQFFNESRGYVGFNGGGAVQVFGNAAAAAYVAQSFTTGPAGWTAINAWMKLAKYGSPADNLSAYLWADNAGVPGTVLANVTLAGSTLTGDLSWTRFSFSSGVGFSASTAYWVGVGRTGAADLNNYYRAAVDEGLAFLGGAFKVFNGTAWVNRAPDADMAFAVNGQAVTTDQVKVMGDPTAGGGQFLAGVFVQDASGVNAWQYRNGKETCLDEIKALLDMGTSAGERLQAIVTAERWLVVRKVALSTSLLGSQGAAAAYLILANGELRDRSGGRLAGGMAPVGKWARVQGLDMVGGDASAAGAVLLTGAEWDGQRLRVNWE